MSPHSPTPTPLFQASSFNILQKQNKHLLKMTLSYILHKYAYHLDQFTVYILRVLKSQVQQEAY